MNKVRVGIKMGSKNLRKYFNKSGARVIYILFTNGYNEGNIY